VIPTTLLGLAVLAAGLGPGYLFVRVEERRRPRIERSQLLEVAELLFIGGLASTTAALAVLSVASHFEWIKTNQLANQGVRYVIRNPGPGLGGFLATLVIAYAGAWAAARLIYRRDPPSIYGFSAWHRVLADEPAIRPYATVGLTSGLAVAGDVSAYTVDDAPLERRELVLEGPLKIREPGETAYREVYDQYLVVNGSEIRTLSVTRYEAVEPLPLVDLSLSLAIQAVRDVSLGAAGVATALALRFLFDRWFWVAVVAGALVGVAGGSLVWQFYRERVANAQDAPAGRAVLERRRATLWRAARHALLVAAPLVALGLWRYEALLVAATVVLGAGLARGVGVALTLRRERLTKRVVVRDTRRWGGDLRVYALDAPRPPIVSRSYRLLGPG
jgi:hypothetical protein